MSRTGNNKSSAKTSTSGATPIASNRSGRSRSREIAEPPEIGAAVSNDAGSDEEQKEFVVGEQAAIIDPAVSKLLGHQQQIQAVIFIADEIN